MNDDARGTCNTNNQLKFNITMLSQVSLTMLMHTDAYIFVRGTITITGEGANATATQVHERNKQVTFKDCAPLAASAK